MTIKYDELRAQMSPESQARSRERANARLLDTTQVNTPELRAALDRGKESALTEPLVTLTQEDIDACTDTLERVEAELAVLEPQLAAKFNIQGDVRAALIKMSKEPLSGSLDDGHIGMDWCIAYERFLWFTEGQK